MTTPPALGRRSFLGFAGASAGAVLLGTGTWDTSALAAPRIDRDPFTLGVGSGDPRPDGVVLWTRLAPRPLAADGRGGLDDRPVRVHYEVATDERFRRVVRRGSVVARAELGHSVHPEISGLDPDRVHWYRFRTGRHLSPVGRTRTSPRAGSSPRELRFAFASCQQWQAGHYTAYEHMAREDLDLVVHLGDYIYERGFTTNVRGVALPAPFRKETFDLARYRLQYALYKSDPALQAAHAAFPWVHTMDDHEVENNYAGSVSQVDKEPDQDRRVFRRRRAAAYQAMYENLPLRRSQLPSGPDVRLHRRLRYGTLADLTMLDTRQYRSDQACEGGQADDCAERYDPDQTMLGGKQRRWLLDGFSSSPARWQILGNQAPIGQTDFTPVAGDPLVDLDAWDGYVAERNRVLGEAQDRGVRNLVVITGDRHQNYAWELRRDYDDPGSAVVGTEFVGTSISSGGDGYDVEAVGRDLLAANPHLKFFNGQRGYVRVTVDRRQWRTDFRVVSGVVRPGAPIRTRASVVVDRRPELQLD